MRPRLPPLVECDEPKLQVPDNCTPSYKQKCQPTISKSNVQYRLEAELQKNNHGSINFRKILKG
jgi:hypothetical protein